jgi:iron complex transport system substrate-binding protein
LNPSIEWLAAQRPDLVIAWADGETRSVIDRLAELGIAAYGTRVETLAEHDEALRDLGVLTGLEAQADSLRASITADLDAVRARVTGLPRRRVLFLVGYETPFTAGPGTFLHELIEAAGGRNVFGDLPQRWAQVSVEEIVRRRPDVIVVATRSPGGGAIAAELARRPGWRDTEAVRAGRVFEVEADRFTRVGPDVGRAARQLAELLHGGAW